MTNTLERLAGPENVAMGASVLFAGVADHVYTVKNISIVNQSAGPITIKLGINGVADDDLFLPSTTLLAKERAQFDGVLILAGVETVNADASASGLTFAMSGMDQS